MLTASSPASVSSKSLRNRNTPKAEGALTEIKSQKHEVVAEEKSNARLRKKVLTLASKEIATSLGSHVLLSMLAKRGMTMRQLARDTGFDVSVLSNIATGKGSSGPELWTLIALADAMNLDLEIAFSER